MRHIDQRRYEMFLRVRQFGHAHPSLFAPDTVASRALEAVVGAIANIKTQTTDHASCLASARAAVVEKQRARRALRHGVDALIRTARAMSQESRGVQDRFAPPAGTTDLALLHAARAILREARPLEAAFRRYHMPANFLAAFERDIAAFDEARSGRSTHVAAHVAARVSLETTVGQGMRAVQLLDACVANQLSDDAAKLAVWSRARRVAPARQPHRHPAVLPHAKDESGRTAPAPTIDRRLSGQRASGAELPVPPIAAVTGVRPGVTLRN